MANEMDRRRFLGVCGSTALATACSGTGALQLEARQRNIIFILIDDQRYDAMSCMGHPFLKTPNLDRLAHGGALFRNAFVTTSLCAPSRATVLSGQYAHRHGVVSNGPALPPGTPTFPLELRKNGYETAFIGKWHMGRTTDEPRPGFNHWVSFPGQGAYRNPRFNVNGEQVKREGYITDLLTDYSVEFLDRPRETPFCLYLSHKAVHYDFQPAERHKNKYLDVVLTLPTSMVDTEQNYGGKPAWVRAARNSVIGVDGMYWGRMPYDTFIRDYNRTMLGIDESIGKVLDALKTLDMLDSTLIVFTSDNGHLNGEHGLIDKRNMYEESIRVPMIVHCPEIVPAGLEVEQMVLNIDVAPTLLDAAGVSVPGTMQGASFLPLARGESIPWRESFLYEYFREEAFPQNPTVFGVRTNRWKYMWYPDISDKNELYDVENDPQEMTNLIDAPGVTSIRNTMKSELSRLLVRTGVESARVKGLPDADS